MTKFSRRAAANIAAWRQGIPKTQAGVDAMWAGIVGKLNATIPDPSRAPIAAGRTVAARAAPLERGCCRRLWAASSPSSIAVLKPNADRSGRASPARAVCRQRAVDWSEIATGLNAKLVWTPARRAR